MRIFTLENNLAQSERRVNFFVYQANFFGGLLFGYDTGVALGAAIGSISGGKLADIQGRRANISTLSVIFFFATLGCAPAPTFEIMLVSRFALGLAVGGASVTVPAYPAEISPAETRGRMVT